MKAKKKPLDVISADDLGIALVRSQEIIEITAPAERSAGEMVTSVSELVDKLKNEAKVL